MPDVGSVPVNFTATGLLNQPLGAAAGSVVAPVTVGLSLSILNCRWNVIVDVPSVAVQSTTSELDVNVRASGQFEDTTFCACSVTPTFEMYHPFSPAVPDVIVY